MKAALRQTHFLLSGWDCKRPLNKLKQTRSSADQFSSSTAGPSFMASAPGCLSLNSRGTSRTSSDTIRCIQWFIRPNTILKGRNRECVTQGHTSRPQILLHLRFMVTSEDIKTTSSVFLYRNVHF